MSQQLIAERFPGLKRKKNRIGLGRAKEANSPAPGGAVVAVKKTVKKGLDNQYYLPYIEDDRKVKRILWLGGFARSPLCISGLSPACSRVWFNFPLPADEVPNLLNVVDKEALLYELVELGSDSPGGGKHEHLFAIIDELV